MPTSTSAAITSEVAIGRLMKGVEMLMRAHVLTSAQPPVCAAGGSAVAGAVAADQRAVLQPRLAVQHDLLPGIQALA